MLYYFFALLLAAFVILFNDLKNESNRWAAFFLCCAAVGGTTDVLERANLNLESHAAQFINYVLTPYGVLIFSLVYSGVRQTKIKGFKWILLLPVGVMLASDLLSPGDGMNYWLLLSWTAPYYLISCYVIIISFLTERDSRKKKNRLVTSIIIVPTILAVLIFIYVAKAISPDFEFFNYIAVFICYSLAAGLLGTFLFNVLGVRLRFERDQLEGAMKAAGSGSALLNHTIKNEIGKIALSAENLRNSLSSVGDNSANQHLDIISSASEHMLSMVSRIHDKTKEIVLREQPCRLDQLADECIQRQQLLLMNHNIRIIANYFVRPTVLCDTVHMKEVISNLISNAIEAIPAAGGTIEIQLNAANKGIFLIVEDNGQGILPEQLVHVFDPFFSTKNRARNFGLGLSYVHNVMKKTSGTVQLSSRENIGTTIKLYFPKQKIVQVNRSEPYEPH